MEIPTESVWLWEAIRTSLHALDLHTTAEDEVPPEQRDPRFRKLVQGVLWSKKFILTYQLLLIGILLIVSAVHWIERFQRWRKRRLISQHSKDESSSLEETSSSGSSTILGDATPPCKNITEETPLLLNSQDVRPSPLRKALDGLNAALVYQPRPLPFVEKILPSNATSLVIILFLALQIFYATFRINFTWFEIFVFADRCGLVFVANLPILYLMAAKTQPIRVLTGYSYESLNIFHRRLGEVLCLAALLHTAGMIAVWYTIFKPSGFTFISFMLRRICFLGFGAFLSYEILYATSLASFRQRWYELFLGLHIVLQAAALILVWFHHHGARPYVGVALLVFVVDRVAYRFIAKSQVFEAEGEILEDKQTTRLSMDIDIKKSDWLSDILGGSVGRGWQATDHVFLSILGRRGEYLVQSHPFTIASAAPREDVSVAKLELLIRAQKGFSAELLREVSVQQHLRVRLDGPYGSNHARNILEGSNVAILVAGGSGIAVCWPLVHHLLNIAIVDAEQGSRSLRKKIVLIWVIHKTTHLSWVGRDALQGIEHRGVETIIPQATEEVGRPDLDSIINEIVGKYATDKKIGIVASGPDSMGRAVRNTSAGLVGGGRKVNVIIEKFGW